MSNQNADQVDAAYIVAIEDWHEQQEEELRAPDSWLSITGLFVLREGEQSIGSDAANDISLPASAPTHLGLIEFHEGKAHLIVSLGVSVLIDGKPLQQADLVDNGHGKKPTLVTTGSVTFFVHKFGERYAIRVKDSNNPAIRTFSGRTWFEVKPEYRLQGRFVPHNAPRTLAIRTVVDTDTTYISVGTVEFELQGQKFSLLATEWGRPTRLHIVFRDATAGVETYKPGRFLTVDVEADGHAVVDFNQAYNPPCAFSPYATCPLPPRENILPIAIAAGERVTQAHDVAATSLEIIPSLIAEKRG